MALLNLDPNMTVIKLKKAFKTETGLDLIVYCKDEVASENMQLSEILRKGELRPRDYRSKKLNYFYFFEFNIETGEFKKKVLDLFGIKVDIIHKGSILKEEYSLSGYIPSKIKNRKYDPVKVNAVNGRLIKIEKDIYDQWLDIKKRLDPKLADPTNWLFDYEVELKVDYYINDSDHLFDENTDSLLLTKEITLFKGVTIGGMINDGEDHTCPIYKKGFTSPHCYLFHDLYDHQIITFKEIQRIGSIWVDINVWHQHCYE